MRGLTIMLLATAVASCGDSGNAPRNAQSNPGITVRSAEQDQLHKLEPELRHIALKRAIRDSGLRCKRVTDSGYVQEYNKLSMWTASCDDKRSWAIFVGPDGSAQVRPCGDMEQLKLPQCKMAADSSKVWRPPETQP